MLKRICTLFMAFAFVTTATAGTIGQDSVREAINEFNYSVKVEWDQQDRDFYQAQVKKLESQIAGFRAAGMSNAEIVKAAVSNVQDQKLASELIAALNVVQSSDLSAEDAQKMIFEAVRSNGNQGANWTGGTTLIVGVVLVGLILAAALAGGSCVEDCGGYYYYDPYYPYYDPYYYYYW